MAKIEFEYFDRRFNREMDDPLLEVEYNILKVESKRVFEIIEQKKVPLKQIVKDVETIYNFKYFWAIYISLLVISIGSIIFNSDIGIFLVFIIFGTSLKILHTFKATYNSAKDGYNLEKQYYETHNRLVEESNNYNEYLALFQNELKEDRIGWRPQF